MSPAPSRVSAALRIVRDAAVYRLRKREMGNLATSSTLALALGLSPRSITERVLFGTGLNLFVYLVNDCFDVRVDLAAPGRDRSRTAFLAENLATGWGACAALAVALGAVALASTQPLDLLVTLAVNVVVIFAYSGLLKHKPIVDVGSMFVWGVSMGMVGFPLASHNGLLLALLLGALSAVTECVQVLRDEPSDREAGVHTTAVVLGRGHTRWLARALMLCASLYATLEVDRYLGPVFLLSIAVPLERGEETRGWDRLRALFGLTWIAILMRVWLRGRLDGVFP